MEEEARLAAEQAQREEEEHEQEWACLAEDRVWAEEEARAGEEEEQLTVDRSLQEVEGFSRKKAPQQ